MTASAVILDATGHRLTADEKAFFKEADPLGFILFGRNIDTADQVRALCDDMREAVGRDAFITIDQEGGRVQRLRPPLAENVLPPLDHAIAAGDQAEQVFYLRYRLIADELRSLGIDSNCAPLLDVATTDTHPFLRNRCYAKTADTVIQLGRAAGQSMLDGGVLPIMKHIPGHGRALSDSHEDLPVVDCDRADLEQDFAPFRALCDMPMGMTAHVSYSAIDPTPATFSKQMIDLIRTDMQFDGLLMSDDITMQALNGSLEQRVDRTLSAGCDVVLLCNASLEDRVRVTAAAGSLSTQAKTRAKRVISMRKPPQTVDIPALKAKLDAISVWRDDG